MRTCLGIFCGIIFLFFSSLYLLFFNIDHTLYDAKFNKIALNSSGIYQSLPGAIVELISSGQITTAEDKQLPPATKEILIETVNTVITPDTLKKHSESIIDQIFSNQKIVSEDLSDINSKINSKMGDTISQMFGISVTPNPSNTFVPNAYSFDKSKTQFGQSVIYHQIVVWVSLAITLLFLILLFFSSADNAKSRFKWLGGFLAAATFFTLINYGIFRLVGFDAMIKIFQENIAEAWIKNIGGQLGTFLTLVKNQFSLLYLYEFLILIFSSIIFFIIAAVIPSKQTIAPPASKNENNSKHATNESKTN